MQNLTIYAMHGVVDTLDINCLCHRTMHDRTLFANHLAKRPKKYVTINDALNGRGDALTIDDATVAAKEAALLARSHGHEVSLFANPYNVVLQKSYFFHQINMLLDSTTATSIAVSGVSLPSITLSEKVKVKKKIKEQYCRLSMEGERSLLVAELAAQLGVTNVPLPRFLATLSTEDLTYLRKQGVAIENHGWSHADYSRLSDACVKLEVEDGQQWLMANGFGQNYHFAVPFGHPLPTRHQAFPHCTVWFLENHNIPPGPIGKGIWRQETTAKVWNRTQLVL